MYSAPKWSIVYRYYQGFSDTINRIPVNGTERYYIYSSSKPITCTAALQLYEKGIFQLDDPLSLYLPEFSEMSVKTPQGVKKAERKITIRDLFCMTAGFSYDLFSPMLVKCRTETDNRCPTLETVRYLAREPLSFEPGSTWEYSLCHDVLAAFVETVSGLPFGEYVKRHIFDPLDMTHSSFSHKDNTPDTISPQYSLNSQNGCVEICSKSNVYCLGNEYESGGAGCVSTVEDYACFLEGLRCGKLLRPETVALMSHNHLTEIQKMAYWVKSSGYGLGVSCWELSDSKRIFGWGGAARFFLVIVTGAELTLVYAQHVLRTNCDFRNHQLIALLREMAQYSE